MPVGLYRATVDGRLIEANPALARLLGYGGVDDLLRINTIDTYADPADRQKLLGLLDAENDTGQFEVCLRRRDGSTFFAEIWTRVIRDAPEPHFAGMVNDITARREVEQSLRENESLLRRVFHQSPVGVALLTTEGRFHSVNPALCDMLGRSEAEFAGLAFLEITHPDDRALSKKKVEDLVAGSIDHFEMEKRYLRKDGAVVWGHVSVRLVRDNDGRPIWAMPVVVDTTERRRLEEQFRQAQKMEAVGQLAGGIAHDFNNILTAIMGYSEMLLEQIGTDKPISPDLAQIYEGARRGAGLIQQLLAFSRKQVMQFEVVDLNQVLLRFQRLATTLVGEGIDLAFDLAPEPMPILADPTQLEQVVMNLLVNSRDAIMGSGRIVLRTSAMQVDHEFAMAHPPISPGEYVELSVEDDGAGMDEETKRHLFEPFFTTKEPGKGTGLGLATVFGIVNQMAGYVWVTSEPEQGTKFRVQFPRQAQYVPTPVTQPKTTGSAVGHELILLVEDDPSVRQFNRTVLTRYGYHVIEAGNATEALRQLRSAERWPDLVVTDLIMPGMNGRELARTIRAERADTRVLFTSGYAGDQRGAADPDEPDCQLLEKPFTATALLRRVREVLDAS